MAVSKVECECENLPLCPSTWKPNYPDLFATPQASQQLQKKGHQNHPKAPLGALTQEKVGDFLNDEQRFTAR